MRVGESLKVVFGGLTLNSNTVQFHYGDQKELNAWILSQQKQNAKKYPLIWYVTGIEDKRPNGYIATEGQLILFNLTKTEYLNSYRANSTYKNVIIPLYDLVNTTLSLHPFVTLIDRTPLKYDDKPNFGVNESTKSDFTNKTNQSEQSVATDILDARIIPLKFRIKTDCILTN